MCDGDKQKIERIKKTIANYPDFPKEGILFYDIFPIFADPAIVNDVLDLFTAQSKGQWSIDCVIGLESRGFLLGPPLALRLGVPFVPIRKANKLPGKTKKLTYSLEYGHDTLEVQEHAIKPNTNCIIVDDLLATGGTLEASIRLLESCGAKVVCSMVIIELKDLEGRAKVSSPLYSILQF